MRSRLQSTFNVSNRDCSSPFRLSRDGWLICILPSQIETLSLLIKICFRLKKVNDSFCFVIVHRTITKNYHFPGFCIWIDINFKNIKQEADWWIFNSWLELLAPHTQNVFAYQIEQHNKIVQITRLFIVGLGGTYYSSVMVQPRKLLHSGTA